MGYDLYGERGSMSLNVTGFATLFDVLRQLGADIRELPRGMDGGVVNADTSRQWGELLAEGIARITAIQTPETEIYLRAGGSVGRRPRTEFLVVEPGETTFLPDEYRVWFEHCADFFKNSGGYEQW
jgi:hypothetical protein